MSWLQVTIVSAEALAVEVVSAEAIVVAVVSAEAIVVAGRKRLEYKYSYLYRYRIGRASAKDTAPGAVLYASVVLSTSIKRY